MAIKATRAVGVAITLLGVGALALLARPAVSEADSTPPILNVATKASFAVGTQITKDHRPDCTDHPPGDVWVFARQTFDWTGSDNSGSLRYSVTENSKGNGDSTVLEHGADTSHTRWTTNANQECGGGSWMPASWDVTEVDPAGNQTTRKVRGGLFRLTQDSGASDDSGYAVPVRVSYQGAWSTSRCSCWSNGTTRRSTTAGAAAVLKVTVPAGDTSHLGLVMASGPGRGSAGVLVDGRRRTTVSTWSSAKTFRTIAWQTELGPGQHTVRVVNAATSGHPRIDLDAVLTN